MVPPRQHFETDDLASLELDLRLEIGDELTVIEAVADALLDLALSDERALHAGIEPDRPSNSAALGMIHRNVGTAQYVGMLALPARRRGDTGKGADLDDALLEHEGTSGRAKHAVGAFLGARQIVWMEHQRNRELVATEARGYRIGARARRPARRRCT